MDVKCLENLNDAELEKLFTLTFEAHQIMKEVVARTGRYCNEMYVSTMMNELTVFEEMRRREMAKSMREELGM